MNGAFCRRPPGRFVLTIVESSVRLRTGPFGFVEGIGMKRTATRQFGIFVCTTALLASVACKKEKGTASPDGTAPAAYEVVDTAPLWKLVPKDAAGAVVLSEGTLEHFRNIARTFNEGIAVTEFGRKLVADMRKNAEELAIALEPGSAKAYGWDLSKGAVFYVPKETGSMIMMLPVTDAEAFAKKTEAKKEGDIYVWDDEMKCIVIPNPGFACTIDGDLTALTTDGLTPPPKNFRGHIETYVSPKFLADKMADAPFGQISGLHGVVILEPGGVSYRATVLADVDGVFKTSGDVALLSDLADKKPSGLLSVRGSSGWQKLMGVLPVAQLQMAPKVAGVGPLELVESLTGDFAALVLPGKGLGAELRAGLKSDSAFNTLIGACEEIPANPFVKFKKNGNKCHLVVNVPKGEIDIPEFSIDLWTTKGAVHIGLADYQQKRGDDYKTPASGKPFLDPKWGVSAWGHGGMFFASLESLKQSIPELANSMKDPAVVLGLWVLLHFSEMGLGVHADNLGIHVQGRFSTTWSNPKDLVSQLEPLIGQLVNGDPVAHEKIIKLAKQFPSSPLANDMRGGAGGAAPSMIFGVLAAVTVPAFMKYISKSKTTEARLFIKKASDAARASYMDNSAGFGEKSYPKQSTPITPPLGTCCSMGEKCAPNPALWTHPSWTALHFSIDDPHYYSYQYKTTDEGKSFTVSAFGDLDCDGVYSTFEMYGKIENGEPAVSQSVYRENELE